MHSEQRIQDAARAILSFTDSYTNSKERKQKEQSDSTPSLSKIISSLQTLKHQIGYNNTLKQVIQFPKLLQSLSALSRFKVGTHLKEEANKQSLEVRNKCRDCLWCIQIYGDEQVQSELVNVGYGRIMSITYSTAGGIGEEQDEEIYNGLCYIYNLFKELNEGRNNWQTSFQPLPLLVQRSEEQIEEEGAIEELEAQLDNKGINGHIKYCANMAKAPSLNHFIHRG